MQEFTLAHLIFLQLSAWGNFYRLRDAHVATWYTISSQFWVFFSFIISFEKIKKSRYRSRNLLSWKRGHINVIKKWLNPLCLKDQFFWKVNMKKCHNTLAEFVLFYGNKRIQFQVGQNYLQGICWSPTTAVTQFTLLVTAVAPSGPQTRDQPCPRWCVHSPPIINSSGRPIRSSCYYQKVISFNNINSVANA